MFCQNLKIEAISYFCDQWNELNASFYLHNYNIKLYQIISSKP
jgi:hypothetical protein